MPVSLSHSDLPLLAAAATKNFFKVGLNNFLLFPSIMGFFRITADNPVLDVRDDENDIEGTEKGGVMAAIMANVARR